MAARTASEGATTAASGTVPAGVGTETAGGRMASAVAGRHLLSASFGYVLEKQPARRLLVPVNAWQYNCMFGGQAPPFATIAKTPGFDAERDTSTPVS